MLQLLQKSPLGSLGALARAVTRSGGGQSQRREGFRGWEVTKYNQPFKSLCDRERMRGHSGGQSHWH